MAGHMQEHDLSAGAPLKYKGSQHLGCGRCETASYGRQRLCPLIAVDVQVAGPREALAWTGGGSGGGGHGCGRRRRGRRGRRRGGRRAQRRRRAPGPAGTEPFSIAVCARPCTALQSRRLGLADQVGSGMS